MKKILLITLMVICTASSSWGVEKPRFVWGEYDQLPEGYEVPIIVTVKDTKTGIEYLFINGQYIERWRGEKGYYDKEGCWHWRVVHPNDDPDTSPRR